jgi:valine--pyruvate aminotransferase
MGIQDDWRHRHECIRINYAAQSPERIEQGLKIIADEVRKAYVG